MTVIVPCGQELIFGTLMLRELTVQVKITFLLATSRTKVLMQDKSVRKRFEYSEPPALVTDPGEQSAWSDEAPTAAAFSPFAAANTAPQFPGAITKL